MKISELQQTAMTPSAIFPVSINGQAKGITADSILSTVNSIAQGYVNPLTTPSGDPLHNLYLATGATWRQSRGQWQLNGLYLTNDEMRQTLLAGKAIAVSGLYAGSPIRTNFTHNRQIWFSGATADYYFIDCHNLEVASCMSNLATSSIRSMFNGCQNLRVVRGNITVRDATSSSAYYRTFESCTSLEDVRLSGVKYNISFADSPSLNDTSLQYLIDNASNTSAITVTLHPDRYASLTAEMIAAATAKNISFASA